MDQAQPGAGRISREQGKGEQTVYRKGRADSLPKVLKECQFGRKPYLRTHGGALSCWETTRTRRWCGATTGSAATTCSDAACGKRRRAPPVGVADSPGAAEGTGAFPQFHETE